MTRAELLELLKKGRRQLKKYHVPKDEQTVRLSIDTLENALSEQPQVVMCKDCKNFRPENYVAPCKKVMRSEDADENWFCADGERKCNFK